MNCITVIHKCTCYALPTQTSKFFVHRELLTLQIEVFYSMILTCHIKFSSLTITVTKLKLHISSIQNGVLVCVIYMGYRCLPLLMNWSIFYKIPFIIQNYKNVNAIDHQMEDNMQELSSEEATFTPSDVERALWSSVVGTKLLSSKPSTEHKTQTTTSKSSRGKRKRWFTVH